MLVTKSRAAELAGISRRSFYNHIDKKKISVTKDENGNEVIDIAELKRIYGTETILSNLQKSEQGNEPEHALHTGKSVQPAQTFTGQSLSYEKLILEEKLNSAEAMISQLQSERDRLREDNARTREQLDKALEIGAPIGKLLTDQREAKDDRISTLEKTLADLKAQNDRMMAFEEERRRRVAERKKAKADREKEELLAKAEEENRGLFRRIFG